MLGDLPEDALTDGYKGHWRADETKWIDNLIGVMKSLGTLTLLATLARAASLEDCPGYKASNVVKSENGLTADLALAGEPCNVYGDDLPDLKLLVEHQTGKKNANANKPR